MTNDRTPRVWIFDLDGTLAESKQPIDSEMASVLGSLLDAGTTVVIVSGAGYSQFKKQVAERLEEEWKGENERRCRNIILLPLNGAETYLFEGDSRGNWNRVFSSDFTEDEKRRILAAFDAALQEAGWEPSNQTSGEIIEDRGGQITFSALGQQAPLNLKARYDPDQKIRLRIKKHLEPMLPEFEVRIGGTTSIDVNRKGLDKACAMERVMASMKELPRDAYIFIGDALYEGGNDETVKRLGIPFVQVSGPSETKDVIRRILNKSD